MFHSQPEDAPYRDSDDMSRPGSLLCARSLHSEESHNVYRPSIIATIKSRSMKCVKHVIHLSEERDAYKERVAKPDAQDVLKGLRCILFRVT